MTHDSVRNRRSIRLQGYDYAQAGAYFVSICTQNRACLFGEIVAGEMRLNDTGRIVADEWVKTAEIRSEIALDEWVLMPNHFHGIIVIVDGRGAAHPDRGTARRAPTVERFGCPISGSIPTIVRSFKSAATKRINEMHQSPGMKLWQRNYWEHIVRNEPELHRIREYIRNNPTQWELDALHPGVGTARPGRGTARRAPTEIREPSETYGRSVPCSNNEAWMI